MIPFLVTVGILVVLAVVYQQTRDRLKDVPDGRQDISRLSTRERRKVKGGVVSFRIPPPSVHDSVWICVDDFVSSHDRRNWRKLSRGGWGA